MLAARSCKCTTDAAAFTLHVSVPVKAPSREAEDANEPSHNTVADAEHEPSSNMGHDCAPGNAFNGPVQSLGGSEPLSGHRFRMRIAVLQQQAGEFLVKCSVASDSAAKVVEQFWELVGQAQTDVVQMLS